MDDDFDLRLDWDTEDHSPTQEGSDQPRQGVIRGDRADLVVPVRDDRPAFWAAVNAIDARAVESGEEEWLSAVPSTSIEIGDIPGALEEVREHLASAFDVVRDLAAHLVPLADQLGVLTAATEAVEGRVGHLSEGVDGRLARLEGSIDDVIGALSAVAELREAEVGGLERIDERVTDLARLDTRFSRLEEGMGDLAPLAGLDLRFSRIEEAIGDLAPLAGLDPRFSRIEQGMGELAAGSDLRFSRVEQGMGELAGWIEARFASLEDALGNDLDDFGDEISSLTNLVATASTVQDPAGGEPLAVDLADRLDRLAAGQLELIREVGRLADEVTAYRRRVQVHARQPTVSDDQLEVVVAGVVATLLEQQGAGASDPQQMRPPEGGKARRKGDSGP